METCFVNYLFNKNILVACNEGKHENTAEIWAALAERFNIYVESGIDLLEEHMIKDASGILGIHVPEPFYRGFPQSVLMLSKDSLLCDQVIHYIRTYGMNDFSEPGHSILEINTLRKIFNEKTEIKRFSVITEAEASKLICKYTNELLSGSRPLSDEQYELVLACIGTYRYFPGNCASKNTAMQLICDMRDPELSRYISLYDIPKLAEEMHWRTQIQKNGARYYNPKKLNLKNKDRKLLTAVLDRMFNDIEEWYDRKTTKDVVSCFEQQAAWVGLLHHIHYKPKTEYAQSFVKTIRTKKHMSYMSRFESMMDISHADGYNITPVDAAIYLVNTKGQGALLRNLDYILSRCYNSDEIQQVINKIDSKNLILYYQLLFHYSQPLAEKRVFKFVKHNMMQTHMEGINENRNRRTRLDDRTRMFVRNAIHEKLRKELYGRLGTIYISPEMKNIALPIQEATSNGGYGTLTRGSRIHIPEGKKIRAFTYWERVNDIDLSVIGLDKDGRQTVFSWRNMWDRQSNGITFSGDQTSGWNGGSEYFDIDVPEFKKSWPSIKYLIFCDNVYSSNISGFQNCTCRAGYMLRDKMDSGEVYEPKTVQSAFTVDCPSHFAYLFGIDLETNDFVWLNTSRDSNTRVAGITQMAFLMPYFDILDTMNVYDFFVMQAKELTNDPSKAEIIISDDHNLEHWMSYGMEVIHSYDTERIIQLMNK